jgi:hypothetical protein
MYYWSKVISSTRQKKKEIVKEFSLVQIHFSLQYFIRNRIYSNSGAVYHYITTTFVDL